MTTKNFKTYRNDDEELSDYDPPKGEDEHWGYHLLMDMSGCNKNINSVRKIREFYKELISELKMKTLSDLILEYVDEDNNRGHSAMQMITTSSITFHADDNNMCLYLDIFSCKTFDRDKALQTVQKHFEPASLAHKFIYRDAGPAKKQ
jgi:S-adenosylmethionine/arginine decarboxylase-like enzyme